MSLTGSTRVLYPLLISSIFLEVAIGSACQDDTSSSPWLNYCSKLEPTRAECTPNFQDKRVREMCRKSCGLCVTSTTIPPALPTTTTTTVPSTTTEATTITQPSTVASTAATTDLIIRPTTARTTVQESSSTTQVLTTTARTTVPPTEVTLSPSPPAVSQYMYPWTWTDRSKETKKEKGPHCVIPFIYKGIKYYNCTRGESRPWCPYVYEYVWQKYDTNWGFCPACRGVKPSPPLNITTTSRPAGLGKQAIVNVTWKANSSNEECKYSIKYNVSFTTTDDQKEYFVTALEELHSEWLDAPANTPISVSVQSLNCFNFPCHLSEWSSPISIESSNKYPGPVKNMHVSQSNPTSLTLKWEPNEDDQGVTDYKVNYKNETRFSNGDHYTVTLRDLKPGSKYQISVTPLNEVGYGESVSIEAWTDIDDPTPPKPPKLMEDLTTTHSISVHISPATPPDGARIIGYVLKLKVAIACFRKQEKPNGECCVQEDRDLNSPDSIIEVPPTGKIVELEVEADKKYMICYGVKVRGKHGDPKIIYAEMEDIIDVKYVIRLSDVGKPIHWTLYGFVGAVVLLLLLGVVVGVRLLRKRMASASGDVVVSCPHTNHVESHNRFPNRAFENAELQAVPTYVNVAAGNKAQDSEEDEDAYDEIPEEAYEEIPANPYAALGNVPVVVASHPYTDLLHGPGTLKATSQRKPERT